MSMKNAPRGKIRKPKSKKPHMCQVEEGWLETHTGQKFHFGNAIDPSEIHLEDVAPSLSMQCRYTGHTRGFYSVAEHCVHIADHLKAIGETSVVQLTGLMHDAAETYIGDLARPVKVTLPAFKELELKIDEAVAKRFGTLWPFPDVIKDLDSRIIRDERDQCMGDSGHEWGTDSLEPLGCTIQFWSPAKAMAKFLDRYRQISSRL